MANPLLSPLFNPLYVCVTTIYVDGIQTVTRRNETTIVRKQCASAYLQHCHYPSFKRTNSFVIHLAGKHAYCNLPAYPKPQMFLHMVLYHTSNYYVLQKNVVTQFVIKIFNNFINFVFVSTWNQIPPSCHNITFVTHQRRSCPTKAQINTGLTKLQRINIEKPCKIRYINIAV